MFIAGPFRGTYNALSLGVNSNGFSLSYTPSGEDIVGDNAGDVVQGTIWRGISSCFVGVTCMEYNAPGLYQAMWPMSTDLNAPAKWGHFVGPGYEMKREMAKPLILTSCNLNTTRPSTNPTTLAIGSTAGGSITFPSTVLANQTAVQIAMNSRLKTVPLLFRVYAIPSGLSQSDSYLEPVCPMAMKLFDAV